VKIRICFSKTEAGRYLSHLDLARTMERCLRRIKAPLAFSEGFNPHPRLSFASALAVGTTGRREYLDVELAERVAVDVFSRSLEKAFPPALAFVAAEEIMKGGRSLSAVVNLAVYRISAVIRPGDEKAVADGIASVLAAGEVWRKPKEKPGKKPTPAREVRDLIHRIEIVGTEPTAAGVMMLEMELKMKPEGQLRPQELWEMIATAGGFEMVPLLDVCRMALYILQDGKTFEPMEGVADSCVENC